MAKEEKKGRHIPKMENRKAFFNYEILEKIEAGMSLLGSEVKSLREGGADLNGSFARIDTDQCWLFNCNISPYKQANIRNHEPLRKRKLLLHKRQITKINNKLQQKGLTLVPVKVKADFQGDDCDLCRIIQSFHVLALTNDVEFVRNLLALPGQSFQVQPVAKPSH